jgi:hypothetical protein
MRNMLAVVGALVVAVVAVGWYQGWYDIVGRRGADGHRDYSIEVHPEKISSTVHKVESGVQNRVEERGTQTAAPAAPAAPQAAPGRAHHRRHTEPEGDVIPSVPVGPINRRFPGEGNVENGVIEVPGGGR